MKSSSDLLVDVNGQEIFIVDKTILSSFSGKLSRLFAKASETNKNLKVIFHDFPGGARGFELFARYCYNNGRIDITPCNVLLLNCVAHFMEMDGNGSGATNLLHQTQKYLEGIVFWSWHDILACVKHSQDFVTTFGSSSMFRTVLDCLVQKLSFSGFPVSRASSSDMSSSRWSYDAMSSTKESCSRTAKPWWGNDLMFLNIDSVDKVVRALVSHKLDHLTISTFLFSYRESRFLDSNPTEKRVVVEVVVGLLCLLDKETVSCKKLFDLLGAASCVKVSKMCRSRVEGMIGAKLDGATVDDLLVRCRNGKKYWYDVNMVMRVVRMFVGGRGRDSSGLRKVGGLVDLFIGEMAADKKMGSSKFLALLTLLPDSARDSHDLLYQFVDLYFQVHPRLCEAKRMKICSALNYEKLSASTMEHMSQNSNFPSKTVVKALVAHQMKLKASIQQAYHLKTSIHFQIPHYANKLYSSSDARSHLRGMHWKVMELEKFCRLLQTHMANLGKQTASQCM